MTNSNIQMFAMPKHEVPLYVALFKNTIIAAECIDTGTSYDETGSMLELRMVAKREK